MAPREALAHLGSLVSYPDGDYRTRLDALLAGLAGDDPEAVRHLERFAERLDGLSTADLQELYTRTFDLNPLCALEVGWHLYGEDYQRGAFLVRMRKALRDHGIPEDGELPDHLASMLRLAARLEPDETARLTVHALLPALDKMLGSIEKAESPFLPLVTAIRHLLAARMPAGRESLHA
ncbi:MAG: nitrate reductase molybdenum cofactor assembly chaperone [Acidobacteriota bacterium]